MKKITAILLTFLSISAFAETSVAIIDTQNILVSVEQGKFIQKQLKNEFKEKNLSIEGEQFAIHLLIEKLKTLPESQTKEKSELEEDINKRISAVNLKKKEYQDYLFNLETKLKTPILDRINQIVETVSRNEKVDLTYDINSNVFYINKNIKKIDLTKKVIDYYNEKYPQ